ncbi:killer cell lectin-like receptor subfamily F member 1 isoform X1 [Ornithorhynchus anatinus]|uniref:killer cell lectin-like receptor subfamily F member 1 isoform X1 n=1 Tax=Ornithorhynchus anatinus TaxID=9258 RepID=UPI0004548B6B|nr:killer cell lectin-like receptor subfamily F member 1 isoform X1 [Ornithorhynchus anatinus]
MSGEIVYADVQLPRKNSTPSSPSAPIQSQDSSKAGLRPGTALKVACAVIILLLVAVITLSVLAVPRRRTCPADWKLNHGKCYWISNSNHTKNWSRSNAFCVENKSNLAKIQDLCDLGFIWSQIPASKYWIGLHIPKYRGNWTWLDGSALDWSLFHVNPPGGMDTCAALSRDGIYQSNCRGENPWICQQ